MLRPRESRGDSGAGLGSSSRWLNRTPAGPRLQQRTASLQGLEAGGLGSGAAGRVLVRPCPGVSARGGGGSCSLLLLVRKPTSGPQLTLITPTAPPADVVTLGHLKLGAQTLSPQQEGVPAEAVLSASPGAADDSHTCTPARNDAHRITKSTGPVGFSSCEAAQVSLYNYNCSPRCLKNSRSQCPLNFQLIH